MDLGALVRICQVPTDVAVQLEQYLIPVIHLNVSTSRLAGRMLIVQEMPSAVMRKFVSAQNQTRVLTVRVHVLTYSVLPTHSALFSMENQDVCVTKDINLLDQVSRDVLISMSVWEILVEKELSVKISQVITGVCVQVDSLVIQMLPVLESRIRSNVVPQDHVQLENFAAKESVFVKEVSKEKDQEHAEILMNVLLLHLRTLFVDRMLSVKIFQAALIVNVQMDIMATHLYHVNHAMEMIAAAHHPTILTLLVIVFWRDARPRQSVLMEQNV